MILKFPHWLGSIKKAQFHTKTGWGPEASRTAPSGGCQDAIMASWHPRRSGGASLRWYGKTSCLLRPPRWAAREGGGAFFRGDAEVGVEFGACVCVCSSRRAGGPQAPARLGLRPAGPLGRGAYGVIPDQRSKAPPLRRGCQDVVCVGVDYVVCDEILCINHVKIFLFTHKWERGGHIVSWAFKKMLIMGLNFKKFAIKYFFEI